MGDSKRLERQGSGWFHMKVGQRAADWLVPFAYARQLYWTVARPLEGMQWFSVKTNERVGNALARLAQAQAFYFEEGGVQ